MSISQNFPAIDPTLTLNFQGARRLDPRISFTRASTATYVGKDGLIKTAQSDEARFDHDPETSASLGLLIEEQRTNLYPHSYLISNWPIKSGTFTDNYAISPDGTQNATRVVATNTDPYFYYNIAQPAGTYTLSIWVKGVGSSVGKIAQIRLGGTPYKEFTIPSEWTRFSHTLTYANSFQSNIGFEIPDTNAQAGDEVYVWGAQFEQGSFPTSYIPTSGSAVTRQPDNASITGTNFTDFYNQSEGTLSSISSIDYLDIDNQPTAVLSNDSVNFIGIGYRFGGSSSGTTGSWINYGGDQFYASGGNILSNVPFKQSITYKTNDAIACVDGTLSSSDNNVILPFPNSLYIGKSYGGYNMRRGHIRSITYYPERLTNTQLQNLTK